MKAEAGKWIRLDGYLGKIIEEKDNEYICENPLWHSVMATQPTQSYLTKDQEFKVADTIFGLLESGDMITDKYGETYFVERFIKEPYVELDETVLDILDEDGNFRSSSEIKIIRVLRGKDYICQWWAE